MFRFHHEDATGWKRDCASKCEPEVIVCTTTKLVLPIAREVCNTEQTPPDLLEDAIPRDERPMSPEIANNSELVIFQ